MAIKAVSFCGSSETISCASLKNCKKCLVVFHWIISNRVFSWYTKLCFVEKVAKISSCFSIIYLPRTFGHNCQNNWGVVVQNNPSIIITGLFRQRFQHTFEFYRDNFDCDGFSGGNRSHQTVTNWTKTATFLASLLKLFDPLPLCHCLLSPFVEGKLGQELLCRLPIVRSCSHRFWGSRSRRAG